ncbi:hypothetical protein GOB57_20975 [Sinorhizobium meliloti]|nr:hypothetical protein [Sinorhizobium meliloti]
MLCRYETPMVVTGIPEGSRNLRNIIGKRTGRFELREYPSGGIVQAGRLVRPRQVRDDLTYHAAVDGSGLFSDIGALGGSTFSVDSIVPAVDEALKELQLRINNHGKAEIRKLWHPPELAEYTLRYPRPGARQFREIDPERERIENFDDKEFDRRHDALGAKLASSCVTSDGRLYNVEPMPFIAVCLSDKEVLVTAEIGDASDYLASSPKCVRLFGITERDAAANFARNLAADGKLAIGGHPFHFDGVHPEFFAIDGDAWHFRLVAQHLGSRFKSVAAQMGALSVAQDMPFEAMEIARTLLAALDDPLWSAKLDALEAAATAAIDYDEAAGSGYFFNPQSTAQAVVVDMWKDRVVDVGFSGARPSP